MVGPYHPEGQSQVLIPDTLTSVQHSKTKPGKTTMSMNTELLATALTCVTGTAGGKKTLLNDAKA